MMTLDEVKDAIVRETIVFVEKQPDREFVAVAIDWSDKPLIMLRPVKGGLEWWFDAREVYTR